MQYRFFEETDYDELHELERRIFPEHPEDFYRTALPALRFYTRSGHSFVADSGEALKGFILAQAVWQGDRATVLATRIAASDAETYTGLLRALVKSAYDAGAYEVAILVEPGLSSELEKALEENEIRDSGRIMYARVLGQRGASGEKGNVLS